MIFADTMLKTLKAAVAEAGGQKQWALKHGVSVQYVNDCLHERRQIGAAISMPLGYRPVTVYMTVRERPQ